MLERNKKPQFCIITPTEYLEKYASQSSMHLVLAHLVDSNNQYANFYANRSEFKIMDCSAFELGQSFPPEKLIELGNRCKADVLVLPDYPFEQSLKTTEAAIKYIPQFKQAGFLCMYVPQSRTGDWHDWLDAYSWASWNDDIDIIGISILGVPNSLNKISKSYARVVATAMLQQNNIFNFNKYHHYLGLNSPNELASLISMNAVDSCDSSNPVWCGINGLRYNTTCDSYMPISKKLLREVDFDQHLISKSGIHEAIQYNIDVILDMFDNPQSHL